MPEGKNNNFIRSSLMIATIYAIFGGLWILFSDRILAAFVTDAAIMSKIQTYKGWTYVAVTAMLVYILVRSMEKKLFGYMKDIERKNEELESVISVSSHDLKSPLVNIAGFSGELLMDCSRLTELMKDAESAENKKKIDDIVTERIPESLGFIVSSTQRMQELQRSFLRVCHLGKEEFVPEELDMNSLVREVNDSLKYLQEEKGVKVVISDLPGCVGDRSQISQVFTNLIENSLKYLKEDVAGTIEVFGRRDGAAAVYCVKDNGIGINERYHGKIFELFHRLEPESGVGGDGVGLTIVTRIVSRHNGRLWVDSKPGEGSSFYVSLPAS